MAKDRSLTVKFLGDPSGLQQSASRSESLLDKLRAKAAELDGTFDETATSGQRMGALLTAMAGQISTELDRAKAASSALAASLGEEQVAAIERAGGSIDATVEHLRRLGLSYEDVAAEADQLAVGVKALNDVELSGLNAEVRQLDDNLGRVHRSGDQSRSVLANMVGNSLQDLGQLGGLAGSAGVALGQVGEYAADGNIALGNMAKTAVPLIGLGVAVWGISQAMEAAGKHAADVKRQTELLIGVQNSLADKKYAEAAEQLFAEYEGTLDVLRKLGYSADDFVEILTGQKDITAELTAELDKHRTAGEGANAYYDDAGHEIRRLIDNLDEAKESYGAATEEAARHDVAVRGLTVALQGGADAIADQAAKAEYYRYRIAAAKEETADLGDAASSTASRSGFSGFLGRISDLAGQAAENLSEMTDAHDRLMGRLDERAAWRNLTTAIDELDAKVQSGTASWGDLEAASDDVVAATASVIETMTGVPSTVKTMLYQELDAGNLDTVMLILENLKKGVDVPVRLLKPGELGYEKNAVGTSFSPGGLTLVGEEGPEFVEMPRGAKVYNAARTQMMRLDAAAAAASGSYSTSVTGGSAPLTSASSGGSSSDEATRMRNMFERGAVSEDAYVEFLRKRQSALEPYSAEEQSVWRELQRIDEQRRKSLEEATDAAAKAAAEQIAEEDRIMEARKNRGEISLQDWLAYLEGRRATMEPYSAAEIQMWEKIEAARKQATAAASEAAAAAEQATADAFDAAAAAKEFADAADAADAAMANLSSAGANLAAVQGDKKKTAAEKAKAAEDFEEAKRRAAEALYRRADAGANQAGLDDGTVEWSRAVRAALTADKQNAPALAGYIDRWLLSIPALAQGGVVPATPGGMLIRAGEAGKREIVSPEDVMANVMRLVLAEVGAGRTVHQYVTVSERATARELAAEAVWALRVSR